MEEREALFPVVGLGASAGGLEALQTFFDHVPEECGIAFVVITHTLPDRKSLLPDLLATHCKVPVSVVDGPTAVEPNHVYLAQPGERIHIQHGILQRVDEPRTIAAVAVARARHAVSDHERTRSSSW